MNGMLLSRCFDLPPKTVGVGERTARQLAAEAVCQQIFKHDRAVLFCKADPDRQHIDRLLDRAVRQMAAPIAPQDHQADQEEHGKYQFNHSDRDPRRVKNQARQPEIGALTVKVTDRKAAVEQQTEPAKPQNELYNHRQTEDDAALL